MVEMSIYYGLVGKPVDTILCDYTSYSGNFQQYALSLMSRIEADTKKTFELDDYFFHYINEDGITFLCMTDKKYNRK